VWCETRRYQCLENLFRGGGGSSSSPLTLKATRPDPFDCVSKEYWVLLPFNLF